MSDMETMLRNQVQTNLTNALDSAVQAGDIQAARKATQQLQEFALTLNKTPAATSFTNADIRTAIKAKASWFGVDPRRSAKVVEFGKNMEPQSFKSAEEFADAIIKAVDDEFKTEKEEEEEIEKEKEDEGAGEKKVARKKTDAPSGDVGRAVPRSSSGLWTKLSDAPRDVAEHVRNSAEKYTRNATKEQREKYIATALATAYAADQRAKGRK